METKEKIEPPRHREDDREHQPQDGKSNGKDAHDAHDSHEEIPKDLPKVSNKMVAIAGIVIAVAFVALFLLGFIPHYMHEKELDKASEQANNALPAVQVQQPKRIEKSLDIFLPASISANQQTSIFPRATGYLGKLLVDIGDHVQAGQLLAEISVPDLDAQLEQAQAAVVQAQASLVKAQDDFDLSSTTFERYQGLAQTGGVTQQQLDEKRSAFTQAKSDLAGAKANVVADQANADRLTALTGFEKVTAPFTGTVSARNYDVGALLNASNNAAGSELFRLVDSDVLRVFVNVPQVYVSSIKTGQPGYITVSNYPGKEFKGVVTRTAGALDPTTRTLRYEIDYQNKDNQLYAGMYAQTRLQVTTPTPPMVVGTSSLIFDSGGTKVWIVVDGKSQSKKVVVGRDFGTEVEISGGLDGSEAVVTNPGLWLADGADVQVINPQQPDQPHTATADAKDQH